MLISKVAMLARATRINWFSYFKVTTIHLDDVSCT
nr:MAG TPA: hypothetical protein [Caudoviricetes sp.]